MTTLNHQANVLEVVGLSAGYNGRAILQGVSLTVEQRQSVVLIGPNGCGKSTLFRVIAGMLQASAGEVRILGKCMLAESPDVRIRTGLGYFTQTRNVFAGLTVEENLLLASESMGLHASISTRMEKVLCAFSTLREEMTKRAGLLSGGQRQSLAAAMVLMRPAKLLLLDEPVAGLAPTTGDTLLRALKTTQSEAGFATIIVEHRLRQVQPYVDRVLVMRDGQIVDDTTDTERMLDAQWVAGHYTKRFYRE